MLFISGTSSPGGGHHQGFPACVQQLITVAKNWFFMFHSKPLIFISCCCAYDLILIVERLKVAEEKFLIGKAGIESRRLRVNVRKTKIMISSIGEGWLEVDGYI